MSLRQRRRSHIAPTHPCSPQEDSGRSEGSGHCWGSREMRQQGNKAACRLHVGEGKCQWIVHKAWAHVRRRAASSRDPSDKSLELQELSQHTRLPGTINEIIALCYMVVYLLLWK